MTIIDTLVTDRTVSDIERIATLLAKPLNQWTAEELSYYAHGDEEVLYASDTVLVAIDGEITVHEGVVRGSYNADDLNRVGAAVQYLRDRLYTLAGEMVDVTAKADWTKSDIPTVSDMEAYLADISAIREALNVPDTVPAVPVDMVKLTHTEANNIEQILWDVNELIMRIIASWRYAGELFSGEV